MENRAYKNEKEQERDLIELVCIVVRDVWWAGHTKMARASLPATPLVLRLHNGSSESQRRGIGEEKHWRWWRVSSISHLEFFTPFKSPVFEPSLRDKQTEINKRKPSQMH